jgi:hypothetical protein
VVRIAQRPVTKNTPCRRQAPPYATAPGLPSSRQREKLRLALDGSERMLDLILSGVPARRVRWSARATAGVIIEKRDSRGGIQAHLGARGYGRAGPA